MKTRNTLLLFCLLFLSLPAGAAPPAKVPWAPHRTGRAIHKCLVATRRIHARSNRPAEKVHVWFLLPSDEPGQKVEDFRFQPEPKEILTDEFGRKIAHFYFPEIPAGGWALARWAARVSTSSVRFPPVPALRSRAVKADEAIRRLYLADGPYYKINDPYIRKTAARIKGGEKDPALLVRKIALHLSRNLSYEMTGGWDDAATVLRRGTGSCSEYTYTFIALCRAAGIPARFVGATMCRRAVGPSFDRPHHRWAEAFLEGYGWVQVDPLRRDCLGRNSFTISSPRCVLGHGDGGVEPMGWKYTSTTKARGRPSITEEFFWCEDPGKETYLRILDLGAEKEKGGLSPVSIVNSLARIEEGLCVPFLADHLADGDEETLREAARALCRIDTRCARDVRYRFRRSPEVWKALARNLERVLGKKGPRKAGEWIPLFPGGKRPLRKPESGPFRRKGKVLTNSGRDGTVLFPYLTGDRYVIDLTFKVSGAGECALLFACDGREGFLKLPFFPPDFPLRKKNYIQGTTTSCRRGLYAVEPGKAHRAVVAVDRWKASFYLDGKKIFTQNDPAIGLGRIGLSAWGGKTTLSVGRLHVFEAEPGENVEDTAAELSGPPDSLGAR